MRYWSTETQTVAKTESSLRYSHWKHSLPDKKYLVKEMPYTDSIKDSNPRKAENNDIDMHNKGRITNNRHKSASGSIHKSDVSKQTDMLDGWIDVDR